MPRHVAFLRGVSPLNAKMHELRAAFEAAGFDRVRTVLGSGNVVFDADESDAHRLEQRAEAAMTANLGHGFWTVVRSCEQLKALLAADPWARHGIPPEAKRVVSFLREPAGARLALPVAKDYASVFLASGAEVYSAYVPNGRAPVFMNLIERACGHAVTTRTAETVAKCAAA